MCPHGPQRMLAHPLALQHWGDLHVMHVLELSTHEEEGPGLLCNLQVTEEHVFGVQGEHRDCGVADLADASWVDPLITMEERMHHDAPGVNLVVHFNQQWLGDHAE